MLSHRNICLHCHFYQPPRENPWLEAIEYQESAHPYHDWNARISAECYRPNAHARILDEHGKLADLVNNYAKVSFNFGPTLLSWLDQHDPETYQAVLDGDKTSQRNFGGHGAAIAQAYNHIIMPLANRRDKETQIVWALKDFETRFGRKAESLWLAETAVDYETLEMMAAHDLRYVILAPRQARAVRVSGDFVWQAVTTENFDPKRPYRIALSEGKHIAAFFYDGLLSQGVAFEGLLHNGHEFSERMINGFAHKDQAQLLSIITDGESYGHHHRHGDMALAYALRQIETHQQASITCFGEYLEQHPPQWDVQIAENSSWSCIHGIERWRDDCGCNSGTRAGWHQKWRKPLRQCLDTLRDTLERPFFEVMRAYTDDPWAMRNDYISLILDRSAKNRTDFLEKWTGLRSAEIQQKILKAMEMQRNLLLMYTSCGWFFDEVSGIETVQNLKYACRAIELARDVLGIDCENDFIRGLETIPSNLDNVGNAAVIYKNYVLPARVDFIKLAAHIGIMTTTGQYTVEGNFYCYGFKVLETKTFEYEETSITCATLEITSKITMAEATLDYCVFQGNGGILKIGVCYHIGSFEAICAELYGLSCKDVFERLFEKNIYTIDMLFMDQQEEIIKFTKDYI